MKNKKRNWKLARTLKRMNKIVVWVEGIIGTKNIIDYKTNVLFMLIKNYALYK